MMCVCAHKPQTATNNRSQPQTATDMHRHPQTVTDSHRQPEATHVTRMRTMKHEKNPKRKVSKTDTKTKSEQNAQCIRQFHACYMYENHEALKDTRTKRDQNAPHVRQFHTWYMYENHEASKDTITTSKQPHRHSEAI